MNIMQNNETFNNINIGKNSFWHSTAHVFAQAVKRLYPDTRLAIGPATDNGFYYDIDFPEAFTTEHLEKVEQEMKNIVKEHLDIQPFTLSKQDAIALMKERKEPYKLEMIEALPEDEILHFYKQGEFVDFCKGPHISNTKLIKAIKLTSIAGAYWHGDENNSMLTRVYGISFPKKSQLNEHLSMVEEAKKRDHRKLGKQLGLFTFMDEGTGFPFFLPKGMILKNTLIDFWRKVHEENGYVEISTPMILNRSLWETSGHWDHYKENMYTTKIDGEDYAIKPMNCPGGMLVYNSEPHSYKNLPLRMAELGVVHRHEQSGALHGLMRVRCFTQDDAHIFMTHEQIRDEIERIIHMIDHVYHIFGFEYTIELSTRPKDSIGSDEDWELATNGLKDALDEMNLPYEINEGDGAFYGPKIDFHLKDSLNRTWQCGTIQLDFQLPGRFDATYIGEDGKKHRPIMIHRVLLGSIERFIGILIEHYAGRLPLWLSPVQVRILPVSDQFNEYGQNLVDQLKEYGIRVEIDTRSEKVGYKIREAQMMKVPYMIIVGAKEEESKMLSVRSRDQGDMGVQSIESFTELLQSQIMCYESCV